ncbi:cyclic nucleotide-binding domain-containing protein, partial [Mesorhizobium sp. M2E.F.Ca.ET.154.01.1.1]|uniref:cyclic nucleotide-binding domain-containing protein n=1 Tax=Mesorhizobium sp. M2E.F.Ca.ET.154.01.1.1 TaxID=2500521 RepID=UPI001091D868
MASLDRSLIAGLAVFEGIAAADLDRIVGQARSIRVAKDQPVFEQVQDAHSFFLLLDGHVRVVKSTPDGHEVT